MADRSMDAHVARLRARFLAAMGLSTALACSSPRPRDDGGGIPEDAEVKRYDLVEGAWEVYRVERDQPGCQYGAEPLPSCPSGNFCVIRRPDGAVGNASAPFDACAQTLPYPSEPADEKKGKGGPAFVGGPDVNEMHNHYSIGFSPEWTSHERNTKHAEACCYSWTEPCPGGRPLRDTEGDAIVAPVARVRGDWVTDTDRHAYDLARARHWARAAQFEHASVASFGQFSLQLLALGAPADLIARSHRAALDEIQHARLAFALAAAFGHEDVGPGALPHVATALDVTPVGVLRSTLRDGCVAETLAALQARRDLTLARSHAEHEALSRIADDEESHAELAFATIAWLLTTFGERVRDALARELQHIARTDPRADVHSVVLPTLHALLASPTPSVG